MLKLHRVRRASGRFQGFRPWATAFACLTLAACATPSEPRIVVKEVKIAVPVACSADPGPDPNYPDTDAALRSAPNLYERTKLLLAGRLLRMGREVELKAANSGCR